MIGERSPMESLVAFGVCFVLGAVTVLGAQLWTRHVINREANKNVNTAQGNGRSAS